MISLYSYSLKRAMQMHPPLTISIISNILLNAQALFAIMFVFGCIYVFAFIRAIPSTCAITIQFCPACITSITPGRNTTAFWRACAQMYLKNKRAGGPRASVCVLPSARNTIKGSVIPEQQKKYRDKSISFCHSFHM